MNNFEKNHMQMFIGIDLCLKQNLQFPTLSLIYSLIDSFSWITYGDIPVETRYIKWIEEYMFKEKKLNVNAIDLYSARCAIIHTLTPNSTKSDNKKASVIAYAWGNKDVEILEKSITNSNKDLKALHINDLYDCLLLGTTKFLASDILKDENCIKRMNEHYGTISEENLINYNNLFK